MNAQSWRGLIRHRHRTTGELTFNIGPSYCYSDAVGSLFNQTLVGGLHNFNFNGGFKQTLSERFSYKIGLTYGNYSGADIPSRRHTDGFYSYTINAIQFSVRTEYAYRFGLKYGKGTPFSLYGFIGAGLLNSNVTFPTDARQGKPTSLGGVGIMGIGYQYRINQRYSIGSELEWNYSTNDYLEGYHPPTSKFNDVLVGISFVVAYRIF